MEMYKISVIVPIFNMEKQLVKCINSILNQTYKNLEIILIDDGSTDNSGLICDEYQKKDSRIIVVHQDHLGLSKTLNVGISKISGDYVGFVNGKDWIEIDFYEKLINACLDTKSDISIAGSFNALSGWKTVNMLYEKKDIYKNEKKISALAEHKITDKIWDKLYKRELFETIVFLESKLFEDIYVVWKLLLAANQITCVDTCGYNDVQLESSTLYEKDIKKEYFKACKARYKEISQVSELEVDTTTKNMFKKQMFKAFFNQFSLFGLINKYFVVTKGYIKRISNLFKEGMKNSKYVDIHIVEHCNLNCKGCAHFSSIANEEYISLEKLENMYQNFQTASKFFSSIHLLGGEPLLHPNIISIIEMSRRYFPKKEIVITTNGVKLISMTEEFFEACRVNDIKIYISKYPIKINYAHVEQILKNNKINYEMESYRDNFIHHVHDEKGEQNPVKSYYKCLFGGFCLQYLDGKIFPCSRVAYIRHLNQAFNTNFQVKKKDYIEVSKLKRKWQLILFLMLPKPFCRYCDLDKEHYEIWGKSKKKKEEWF